MASDGDKMYELCKEDMGTFYGLAKGAIEPIGITSHAHHMQVFAAEHDGFFAAHSKPQLCSANTGDFGASPNGGHGLSPALPFWPFVWVRGSVCSLLKREASPISHLQQAWLDSITVLLSHTLCMHRVA